MTDTKISPNLLASIPLATLMGILFVYLTRAKPMQVLAFVALCSGLWVFIRSLLALIISEDEIEELRKNHAWFALASLFSMFFPLVYLVT